MNFLSRVLLYSAACIVISGTTHASFAQSFTTHPPHGWQLMDFATDSVYGAAVNKAYQELLKGKKSHPVIVAVIDGGLDTAQEDLRGHIWINPGEIPNNGIDDDHNGYVDDVHGWNFIGGKNGKNIINESSEADREYYRLAQVFGNIHDSSQVKKKQRAEYRYWLKLKAKRQADSADNAETYENLSRVLAVFHQVDSILQHALHRDTITEQNLTGFEPQDSAAAWALNIAYRIFDRIGSDESLESYIAEGDDYLRQTKQKLDALHEDPNARRREIVDDNPFDIHDRNYGNNNVAAGNPMHGTHVAGIIAATRGNGIGIDGIADNVIIMPIRVVPDGDERDKDVALGIRYAVDNGAQIINMSFGKPYSPQKKWVDKAVKYAERKGVLLVHAAGNESSDDDTVPNYPNADFLHSHRRAWNFINVGASTAGPDSLIVASFSNYGKKEVDLFAPGDDIYSTVTHNQYASYSGTSMASPMVAGVAALILEYYPHLTARQLKYVIEHSVTTLPGDSVYIPGTDRKALFSDLSKTGGLLNAYQALKLAATLHGKRKITKKEEKRMQQIVDMIKGQQGRSPDDANPSE
ncbi:MAG: S8 family peptidase [Thermoflavifilum aggregans]|nr:S8 family peptidase [Thermoflavifilum aggregans]